MINERHCRIRPRIGKMGSMLRPLLSVISRGAMNALLTFGITLGAISVFCYILMAKPDRRRARRSTDSDTSSTDSGGSSDANGFSLAGWFGHSGTDATGSPLDGGGSDSGGGDGGGGGGDGGGGDGGGGD